MKIKKAFNFNTFQSVARADIDGFSEYGETVSYGSADGETYIYQDNGSNVLGIAHLDTVQSKGDASLFTVKGERVIVCPRLDDRLGVYLITHVLPRMGITCDWLLTTGEEIGRSSAELFETDKKYHWAFSFDRAGDDCVLYHYDHEKLRDVLRKFGFVIGHGTFSDLSFLDIGCSGVNIGCGYHDAHGIHAHAFLSETFAQLGRFKTLWQAYKDKPLPYQPWINNRERRAWWTTPGLYTPSYSAYSNYGSYKDTDARSGWSNDKRRSSEAYWDDEYTKDYLKEHADNLGMPDYEPRRSMYEETESERIQREYDNERLERLADEALGDMVKGKRNGSSE